MKRPVSISAAEADVMEVLWEHHPAGTDEIVTALSRRRQWHESTIKTLLDRLRKKGATCCERGRIRHGCPAHADARRTCRRAQLDCIR